MSRLCAIRRIFPAAFLRSRCVTALKTAEETNLSAESRSVGQIIKGNLFTYFNLIFTVLAILVIATGSLRSLTFLAVVIANLLSLIAEGINLCKCRIRKDA